MNRFPNECRLRTGTCGNLTSHFGKMLCMIYSPVAEANHIHEYFIFMPYTPATHLMHHSRTNVVLKPKETQLICQDEFRVSGTL